MTRPTSRLPGFHKLEMAERTRRLAVHCGLTEGEARLFAGAAALPAEAADPMIENAVAVVGVPLGIATNFLVNGRDYLVPMAIEEPSVIAAASLAARIVREAGGFEAEADPPHMIAQIELLDVADPDAAERALRSERERLFAAADALAPQMVARGGGARDLDVRRLLGPRGEPMLVLHLVIDVRDAMGANLLNTVAEGVGALAASIARGRVAVRILSNLADRRLARARCRVPFDLLASFDLPGRRVAEGIAEACRFAEADPYRAATHNKGVMNGVDAVALATANDWRALEAGAHAYAARSGRYGPLSTWEIDGDALAGRIELPIQVGVVGGSVRFSPLARLLLQKVLRVESAQELAALLAAVGLAQNMAALRALGTVGIQRGHMALHNRKGNP
jgi:hydroxymethylglutaryl-CoA reductase